MKERIDGNNISEKEHEFNNKRTEPVNKMFEYKTSGYFKDTWIRFLRNRTFILSMIFIGIIVFYAVFIPYVSNYDLDYSDSNYKKVRPKIEWLSFCDFFDGGYEQSLNDKYYAYYMAMAVGTEDNGGICVGYESVENSWFDPIMEQGKEYNSAGKTYRKVRLDSYLTTGFKYVTVTALEYEKIIEWQNNRNLQIIYPMVDTNNDFCMEKGNANCWYKTVDGSPVKTSDDKYEKLSIEQIKKYGFDDNYLRDDEENILYYVETDKSMLTIRVLYYNFYQYKNGIEPQFYFGTDGQGFDIFVRLAYGLRLSLLLAVFVSAINLIIGTIWGAIEGYYGGLVDMAGERICDIISGIPFIVLISLIQIYFVHTGKISAVVSLFLSYFLTGWIGTAYKVRTQFYRFRNREYIIAVKAMGVSDIRIMVKHILPNALGTIITSSAMIIPGVIMQESMISYLGIINFQGKNITSLGTMISNGQSYLSTAPHIILFPGLMLSLLVIAFNLLGNGLRDAFNPSLKGANKRYGKNT